MQRLATAGRQHGLRVSGLLSPAGRQQGVIWLEDLTDRQRRLLAHVAPPAEADFGRWRFLPATLAWGNARLNAICDTDLLLVDEIGPLELRRRQGLTASLEVVRTAAYRLAVVAVRPALATMLADALSVRSPTILPLTPYNRNALLATLLAAA